jgi:hypothetical protein
MKEETAVMWLQKLLENQPYLYKRDFEKALQMEREQIEQAYTQAMFALAVGMADPEKYYDETYKGGEQ